MWYFALAGIAHFAMMGLPGGNVVDIVCELPCLTRTLEPPVSAASARCFSGRFFLRRP